MAFESVRGYVQLASGLGELTRARALEAAQGLLALPSMAGNTGKVAGQVGALAEEISGRGVRQPREPHRPRARRGGRCRLPTGPVAAAELKERATRRRVRAEVSRLREPTTAAVHGDAGAGTGGRRAGSSSPVAEGAPEATTSRPGRKRAPPPRSRRPPRAPCRTQCSQGGRCRRRRVRTPGAERRPPPCGVRHGRLQSGADCLIRASDCAGHAVRRGRHRRAGGRHVPVAGR